MRFKDNIELQNKVIDAALTSESMNQASLKCGLPLSTFKRYAEYLNVYSPSEDNTKAMVEHNKKNPRIPSTKIPIEDIIYHNKHDNYNSVKLKNRLIKENIFEYKCSICNIDSWNGKDLILQLDHLDGNSKNHHISNLRILCPNCHSQTETFCRGHTKRKKVIVTDEIILENIPKCLNIANVINMSGMSLAKYNYDRIRELMNKHNLKLKDKPILKLKATSKKEKKIKPEKFCQQCNKLYTGKGEKFCSYLCMSIAHRIVDRPSKELLIDELKTSSYCAVGRKYGVSDNTIRKWLK